MKTSNKAKRYTPALKWRAVRDLFAGKDVAQVSRAYDVHPASLTAWKKQVEEHGADLFSTKTTVKQQEKKAQQLEMLLGKKEVEIAFLKNFLDIAD